MTTFVELLRDSLLAAVFHLAPRFANVLLFILLGRLAGPAEAGVFALATTYLLIFTTFTRGLDELLVRQVSREPRQAAVYLTNYFSLRVALAALLSLLLLFIVRNVFSYAEGTMMPILIVGMGVVPDSLTYVGQSIMLGKRRFAVPALIFASISFSRIIIGGIILINGGNLLQIAWLWFGTSLLGMFAMLSITIRQIGGIRWNNWLDWQPLRRHWRPAVSLLFITSVATLEAQADTLILSGFRGEAEVGWYGAATTIAFSLIMFSQAYRFAAFPLMARYALQSPEKLTQLYLTSIRYLGMLILPLAVGIMLLASRIVPLIFGPDFEPTIRVLEIIIITSIFVFLNEPAIRLMLVLDRQNWILAFLLASTGLNITLNLVFVPIWGAVGAASARVSSALVLFSLTYWYASRFSVKVSGLHQLKLPVFATMAMAIAILPMREWPLFVPLIAGSFTYVGILALFGGISRHQLAFLYRNLSRQKSPGGTEQME
jgi:O-antigen/teichoic acid export membrane protein